MTKITERDVAALATGTLSITGHPGLSIEVTPKGKKVWRYKRRVPARSNDDQPSRNAGVIVKATGGTHPATNLMSACAWALKLNREVEAGRDPNVERKEAERAASMTVVEAHKLYMIDVRAGTGSRERRVPKPRTVDDKLYIMRVDIEPSIGSMSIYDVTEAKLVEIVRKKAVGEPGDPKKKGAPVRANRLLAELKVFFNWCCSLQADSSVGLKVNPAARLHQLATPEKPRTRKLSPDEIKLFFEALAKEDEVWRRGYTLMMLTACRIGEITSAKRTSVVDAVWHRVADEIKNGEDHAIPLGPWALKLIEPSGDTLVRGNAKSSYYKVRNRIKKRMGDVEHWTPHDLRRTVRSNTRKLKIDHLTAEAMLAHKLPAGVERIYDQHDPLDDLREAYGKWEDHVAAIVREAGLADAFWMPPLEEAEVKLAA